METSNTAHRYYFRTLPSFIRAIRKGASFDTLLRYVDIWFQFFPEAFKGDWRIVFPCILHEAIPKQRGDLVQYLLRKGCDAQGKTITCWSWKHRSYRDRDDALHEALSPGRSELIALQLVDAGAPLHESHLILAILSDMTTVVRRAVTASYLHPVTRQSMLNVGLRRVVERRAPRWYKAGEIVGCLVDAGAKLTLRHVADAACSGNSDLARHLVHLEVDAGILTVEEAKGAESSGIRSVRKFVSREPSRKRISRAQRRECRDLLSASAWVPDNDLMAVGCVKHVATHS
ncbi:hypothetical protein BJ170DRAFT_73807 [Xylariales sp. AK1849]|nr:hypothetical protein BJ170DRAFT_73807 [Xylariales sp. AK1849]